MGLSFGFGFGFVGKSGVSGTAPEPPEDGALLNEDSTPLLNEGGTPLENN